MKHKLIMRCLTKVNQSRIANNLRRAIITTIAANVIEIRTSGVVAVVALKKRAKMANKTSSEEEEIRVLVKISIKRNSIKISHSQHRKQPLCKLVLRMPLVDPFKVTIITRKIIVWFSTSNPHPMPRKKDSRDQKRDGSMVSLQSGIKVFNIRLNFSFFYLRISVQVSNGRRFRRA